MYNCFAYKNKSVSIKCYWFIWAISQIPFDHTHLPYHPDSNSDIHPASPSKTNHINFQTNPNDFKMPSGQSRKFALRYVSVIPICVSPRLDLSYPVIRSTGSGPYEKSSPLNSEQLNVVRWD